MRWIQLACVLLGIAAAIQARSRPKRTTGSQEADQELLRAVENLLKELDELDGKAADKKETRAYGEPPKWWKNNQRAARSMRSFARASKSTREAIVTRVEREERLEKSIRSLSNGEALLQRAVQLNLQTRADLHPTCETATTCDDRVFIDGKEYRKANGTCNNVANPDWGSSAVQHVRWEEPVYANDIWAVVTRGQDRSTLPEPRTVSNAVHKAASTTTDNSQGVSMALMQFLQFFNHDILLTPEGTVGDSRDCCTDSRGFCMPLFVEEDDDPAFANGYCMDARRSFTYLRDCDGSEQQNQINENTAYIDASNVYGSSQEEQDSLRTFIAGQLKVSNMDFPPEYTGDEEITCDEDGTDGGFCFAAGDSRANVIPTLSAVHVLFLREHNRIAQYFTENHSDWSDEKIFQITRKIVGAIMQAIVYNEVLPVIMDSDEMANYGVSDGYLYDETVDASISSSFAIAFRFGHTLIPNVIDVDGDVQNVTFMYSQPSYLFQNNYGMINSLQDSMDTSLVKEPDSTVSDSARNGLFFDGTDSFDLAALNIARSREWGTPSYSVYKEFCGLGTTSEWSDLLDTHTQDAIDTLSSVYSHPADVDLFTGVVTETNIGTSFLGKVGSCIIGKQFSHLKHGDRFWYETSDSTVGFTDEQLTELAKSSYAAIVCLNSDVETIPKRSFIQDSDVIDCTNFETKDARKIDLSMWDDE